MKRKDFVVETTEQLIANPGVVLRGHGIKPPLLKAIVERPDVIAKLAAFGFSTVWFKQGPKALRKKNNLMIKVYKNFPTFNAQAREDLETFSTNLPDNDLDTFDVNENSLVILTLPNNTSSAGSTEEAIVTGKSTLLKFSSAVRKEYKVPGGMYVVIMWGNSAVRSAEQIKADAKAKVNKKKVKVNKTPEKVKAELKRKANKKLRRLASVNAKLKAQLDELQTYGRQFGLQGSSAAEIMRAQRTINNVLSKYNMENPVKAKRVNAIKSEMSSLRAANRKLLKELETATATGTQTRGIKSKITRNKAKLDSLKIKLGTYNAGYAAKDWDAKSKMLADITTEIESNTAKGMKITDALNDAIAKLNIPTQQKLQIQEAAIEEIVENGADILEAAETAVQQVIPSRQQVGMPQFSRSKTIAEILADA